MPRGRLLPLIMIVELVAIRPPAEDVVLPRYNQNTNDRQNYHELSTLNIETSTTSLTWQTNPFRHKLPDLHAPVYGRAFVIFDNAMIVHVSFMVHDLLSVRSPFCRVSVCAGKFEELWVGWQGAIGMRQGVMFAHDYGRLRLLEYC